MKKQKFLSRLILLPVVVLITVGAATAQTVEDPPSRSITSLDFQAQRPKTPVIKNNVSANAKPTAKSAKRRKNIAVVSNAKRKYKWVNRVASPPVRKKTNKGKTSAPPFESEELGVTFWRLRPAKSDETDAPTFRVETDRREENWTAERVDSTTKFKNGDRVRFTIESSRPGYLYIVNREFYSDGTPAQAMLIFPTLKSRDGDNRVTAGSLIEIPAQSSAPPFFTIEPSRDDYAGEELFVVISPVKIPGIKIGLRAQPVAREKLEKWIEDWSVTVDVYDAEDGEGIAYTETEAEAATVKTRSLKQEEPLPQTIYRVKVRENSALLVPFRLLAKTP